MESSSNQKDFPPYTKYEEIKNRYKNSKSPTLLVIPEEQEAESKPLRWDERLTYYSGFGYLTGALVGGAKGTIQGFKAAENGESLKVRVNRVLNASGGTGRRFGNRLGLASAVFAGIESFIGAQREVDDGVNTVLAGLSTGFVFKAAHGPRAAAPAMVVGALAAGAVIVGKKVANFLF